MGFFNIYFMDFKDWLYLNEGSFTESDIPSYFYVGIKFTEDLIQRKPYTPRGAVSTLLGLEGITSNYSTAKSFASEALLKMPGKATVNLNKLTKVLYQDPNYLTSAFFRTPRRTYTGHATTNQDFQPRKTDIGEGFLVPTVGRILDDLAYTIGLKRVDYHVWKAGDGSSIKVKDIVERMKKVTPSRRSFSQKEKKFDWGSRVTKKYSPVEKEVEGELPDLDYKIWSFIQFKKEVDVDDIRKHFKLANPVIVNALERLQGDNYIKYDLKGKNVKPLRARHAENPIKSLRSATDFAGRLYKVLSGQDGGPALPNHEKLLQQDNDGVSVIVKNAKEALRSNTYGDGEQEWIMKRQLIPGEQGKKCPSCNAFVRFRPDQIDQEVVCPACMQKIPLWVNFDRSARPMLHVPEDSTLYVNYQTFPKWAREIIPDKTDRAKFYSYEEREKFDANRMEELLNKTGVYKMYHVYLVNGMDEVDQISSGNKEKKPVDPERKDMVEKLKDYVNKGINRVEFITKLFEKKEGYPRYKTEKLLNDLSDLDMIRIEGNHITLINMNHSESEMVILRYMKTLEDPVPPHEVMAATGLPPQEFESTLQSLIEKNRVKQLSDKTIEYVIPEEELNSFSSLEEEIIKIIEKEYVSRPKDVQSYLSEKASIQGVKYTIRLLEMKHKIFESKWNGFYVATPTDDSLNELEQKIIDYLKEWPVSDTVGLRKEVGNPSIYEFYRCLDLLEAKKYITADMDAYFVVLNKEKVKYFKNDRPLPKRAEELLNVLAKHFCAEESDAAKHMSGDIYSLFTTLVNKNLVAFQDGRYVPVNKPNEDTEEEKSILDVLSGGEMSIDNIRLHLPFLKDRAQKILDYMVKNKKIAASRHPLQNKVFYHKKDYNFEVDTSSYEGRIYDFVKDKRFPRDAADIGAAVGLSDTGAEYVLDKMVKADKMRKATDKFSNQVYLLPGQELPTIDDYVNIVKAFLTDGPKLSSFVRNHIIKVTGLATSDTEKLVEYGVSESAFKKSHDNVLNRIYFYLDGQEPPSSLQYAKEIYKILEKGSVLKLDEIYYKYKNLNNLSMSQVGDILWMMEKGEYGEDLKIKRSLGMNGRDIYHLPNVDPQAQENLELLGYVKNILRNDAVLMSFLAREIYKRKHIGVVAKNFIATMVNQGLLYKSGNGENAWISAVPDIESIIAVKNQKLEQMVINHLGKYGPQTTETLTYDINGEDENCSLGCFHNAQGYTDIKIAQDFFYKMADQGKLQVIDKGTPQQKFGLQDHRL